MLSDNLLKRKLCHHQHMQIRRDAQKKKSDEHRSILIYGFISKIKFHLVSDKKNCIQNKSCRSTFNFFNSCFFFIGAVIFAPKARPASKMGRSYIFLQSIRNNLLHTCTIKQKKMCCAQKKFIYPTHNKKNQAVVVSILIIFMRPLATQWCKAYLKK